MNRRKALGTVLVLALVAGALLLRSRGTSGDGDELAALRRAAALRPCPSALGPDLPPVTLACLSGGAPVVLRSGTPRTPMLVNIWATWCGPCVREVPLLLRFGQRAGDRVGIVGVLHEDEPSNALEFARQYGMHYPSVVDEDGKVLRAFGSGPPVTLLVDARGRVRHVKRGEFHSLAELQKLVADELGVTL